MPPIAHATDRHLRDLLAIGAKRLRFILVWLCGCLITTSSIAQPQKVVELNTGSETLVGLQLIEASNFYLLLATDGQLHQMQSPPHASTVRTLNLPFTPDSAVAMKAKLAREFGPRMEIVATKHFLVVQPKGRGKHWPDAFENLHRQFTQQMRLRGVDVRTGRFPMVAIVLPDRAALQAELDRQKIDGGNIAGVYITTSNRVYTYDGGLNEATAAVIRHEAAHQSAFNSNVHSRLNETPKWITEGLGMMFEPAAMSSGSSGGPTRDVDRQNADAMMVLRNRYSDRSKSLAADLRRLISGDEMFLSSAEVADAYAISWLLMHFLAERKPAQFAAMLNHTATRPPLEKYSSAERVADFARIVGRSIEDTAIDIKVFLPFSK
jgi:hypothetical protein